jgi:chromosome segregation and condensation protein ScpB
MPKEDPPETARVYEAILQLNGRSVDGLKLAELLGRSVESIEPALDELARRGVVKPKGVGWLTSPVILREAAEGLK